MSWVERNNNQIIIVTGDGKRWNPFYLFWSKGFEFNFTEYNFPNVRGSYVDRRLKKGDRFEIRIVFQGTDHIDQRDQFLTSAENKRRWIMTHPFYGSLTCQPTSLRVDSSGLNTSVITGQVIETISEDFPKLQSNVTGDVDSTGLDLSDSSDTMFEDGDLKPQDQITLQEQLDVAEAAVKDKITFQEQFDEYFNALREANAAVIEATIEPLRAINTVRNVIEFPFKLQQSVKVRVGMLVDQFLGLGSEIIGLVTPNQKMIYEANASATLKAMALAAISPNSDDDYENAVDVLTIQEILFNSFTSYLDNLSELQTDNNNDEDSYIPDFDVQLNIYTIIYLTIANLNEIALNAKQQRIISLEKDSNPVLLAHRFYGLDEMDLNLDKFIMNNNIGISEMLEIKKGREIIYYV